MIGQRRTHLVVLLLLWLLLPTHCRHARMHACMPVAVPQPSSVVHKHPYSAQHLIHAPSFAGAVSLACNGKMHARCCQNMHTRATIRRVVVLVACPSPACMHAFATLNSPLALPHICTQRRHSAPPPPPCWVRLDSYQHRWPTKCWPATASYPCELNRVVAASPNPDACTDYGHSWQAVAGVGCGRACCRLSVTTH